MFYLLYFGILIPTLHTTVLYASEKLGKADIQGLNEKANEEKQKVCSHIY